MPHCKWHSMATSLISGFTRPDLQLKWILHLLSSSFFYEKNQIFILYFPFNIMQRSMSYRKPVPEYIPSPPPSPTHFSRSHATTQPDDECQPHTPAPQGEKFVEKPVPPLPENWREILSENVTETYIVDSTNDGDFPKPENPISEDLSSNKQVLRSVSRSTGFIEGDQESLSTVAPSQLIYLRPKRKYQRGLPTNYRPPTPPLRSKQREDATDHDVQISHIYLSNPYSSYVRVGFPSPGASSVIRPTPSFRTERTLASMNTTNLSMGWPSGYPTSSERVLNHYPMLPKPNTAPLKAKDALPEGSEEIGCWYNASTRFKNWMKKLKLSSH